MYNELLNDYNELLNDCNELIDKHNELYEKYNVSFETPENYAESFFKLLKNKNKLEASKLLLNMDVLENSTNKLNQAVLEEANKDGISSSAYLQMWNDECLKSFDRAYYNGINLGINWQNSVFKKTEFNIEYDDFFNLYVIRKFKVFFTSSNKDYYFRISDVLLINDKPTNWKLGGIYDIQAEKEDKEKRERERKEKEKQRKIELENKPYTPWNLTIGGANWDYVDKTFEEFRIKIKNETDYYVNRVKFRLSIYVNGYKSFSKLYDLSRYYPRNYGSTKHLELQPGDIQEIKIPELNYFYLGQDLSNQRNWEIKAEVLDVYPKHH
tara:strand:- start:1254 stop:2228 length:975 start_codon:yes stop_codon:yes gene_type:complete